MDILSRDLNYDKHHQIGYFTHFSGDFTNSTGDSSTGGLKFKEKFNIS